MVIYLLNYLENILDFIPVNYLIARVCKDHIRG